MKDYIKANMAAYEDTAEEFQLKKELRLKADTRIAETFTSFLNNGDRVLELGTGSGQLARLLCERGLSVDAIEYSPNMARLASLTAPKAYIIVDEFLNHDFGDKQYDGVIGIAFVHLFNRVDVVQVMAKINALLTPGGVLMLATTLHNNTFDDVLKKMNFKTAAYRFRRHYTKEDFEALFTHAGFDLKSTLVDRDSEVAGKKWLSVIATRTVTK